MRFTKGLFGGLGIGLGIAVALFAAAYVLEFVNCLSCGCLGNCVGSRSYNSIDASCVFSQGIGFEHIGLFPIWNMTNFINTVIFCTLVGTCIGCIYGIAMQLQEGKEKKEQKTTWLISDINKAFEAVGDAAKKTDDAMRDTQSASKTKHVSVHAVWFIEAAGVALNNACIKMDEASRLANMVRPKPGAVKLSRVKKDWEICMNAQQAGSVAATEAQRAMGLIEQARGIENEICSAQWEVSEAVSLAENTSANATKEIARAESEAVMSALAKKTLEEARIFANKAVVIAENARKTLEMIMPSVVSSDSKQNAITKATDVYNLANTAKSEAEKATTAVERAAKEDSAYRKAIKEISEEAEAVKNAEKDAAGCAKEAKKAAAVSAKAKEASEKAGAAARNLSKILSEITECLTEASAMANAKMVKYAVVQARALSTRAKEEVAVAKEAQRTAINEEEESKLEELATQGTPEAKCDVANQYLNRGNNERYLHWLKQSADAGYVIAQKELGLNYLDGKHGVIMDGRTAVDWLEKAAEQGDVHCQFKVGYLYLYDTGVADETKAVKWLEKAADSGHSEAYCHLYIHGKTSGDSFEKTFSILRKAEAEFSNPTVMICLGEIYCLGNGIPCRPHLGAKYMVKGIKSCGEKLTADFWKRIGMLFYEGKTNESGQADFANAILCFEKAEAHGDAIAKEYLSDAQERLRNQIMNQKPDYATLSHNELLKLASRDHEAWCYLAMSFAKQGDDRNANKWFEKTIKDTGNKWAGKARYQLASAYLYGWGVEKSRDEALRLYEGGSGSLSKLEAGFLYCQGTETQRDLDKGREYILKAIEQIMKDDGNLDDLQVLELYNIAVMFEGRQAFAIAENYYNKVLKVINHGDARNNEIISKSRDGVSDCRRRAQMGLEDQSKGYGKHLDYSKTLI